MTEFQESAAIVIRASKINSTTLATCLRNACYQSIGPLKTTILLLIDQEIAITSGDVRAILSELSDQISVKIATSSGSDEFDLKEIALHPAVRKSTHILFLEPEQLLTFDAIELLLRSVRGLDRPLLVARELRLSEVRRWKSLRNRCTFRLRSLFPTRAAPRRFFSGSGHPFPIGFFLRTTYLENSSMIFHPMMAQDGSKKWPFQMSNKPKMSRHFCILRMDVKHLGEVGSSNGRQGSAIEAHRRVVASYAVEGRTKAPRTLVSSEMERKKAPALPSTNSRPEITILCHADYHVRMAQLLAVELMENYAVKIIDLSFYHNGRSRSIRLREVRCSGGPTYKAAGRLTRTALLKTKCAITFHDYNEGSRDAWQLRNALGLPTISIVEGLSDYEGLNEAEGRWKYQNSLRVLVPGSRDLDRFSKGRAYVFGRPTLVSRANDYRSHSSRNMLREPPSVAVNVNFTYGVLSHHADDWLRSVIRAVGDYPGTVVYTRHPRDTTSPSLFKGQVLLGHDEALQQCDIFVSRFGTSIFDALELGLKVIYFPPRDERASTFRDPMGAFLVAASEDELALALRRFRLESDQEAEERKECIRHFLKQHIKQSDPRRLAIELRQHVDALVHAPKNTKTSPFLAMEPTGLTSAAAENANIKKFQNIKFFQFLGKRCGRYVGIEIRLQRAVNNAGRLAESILNGRA